MSESSRYVSIVVLLVAAMAQGPSPKQLSAIKAELGMVHRLCQYWKELFVKRNAWRFHRLKFMPPIDESGLPLTLRLEQALGDQFEAFCDWLLIVLWTPALEVHSNCGQ